MRRTKRSYSGLIIPVHTKENVETPLLERARQTGFPSGRTYLFESAAEFADAFTEMRGGNLHTEARDWTGGESERDAVEMMRKGDTSAVAAAQEMLGKLENEIDIESLRPQWQHAVCGAFVNVPDFLSGEPECMRRMQITETDSAPIRVFVATTSSGGLDTEKLRKRGTAALALVMALSQVRQVELYCFSTMGDGCSAGKVRDIIEITRVQSSPLCLSEAAYMMISQGYARKLTYQLGHHFGWSGAWASFVDTNITKENECIAGCRIALNATAQDVIIPPSFNWSQQIITDPLGWVKARLQEHREQLAA